MCGIAGIIGRTESEIELPLRAMVEGLSHRGPDGEGHFTAALGAGAVGLGQRRLAIIDLSPSGQQPMHLPGGELSLTFNGEIYNHLDLRSRLTALGHRFRGSSDTEVLLHWLAEHGPAGLPAVEGMYACAWIAHRTGNLFLARDPFGIKPLYYAETEHGLIVASEVRALLASGLVPRRASRPAVATLLAYGAVQAPFTIVEGVQEFPPAHWGACDGRGRLRTTRFFRFPEVRVEPDPARTTDTVWKLFDRAVAAHLMSDVPVGVLLSSGLDSRLIAATAARHSAGIKSFTLGFTDHPEASEGAAAAAFAETVGLTHTPVWTTEHECLDATRAWLRDLDQPSVDGLNVYTICRAVRRAGIKVALSGLGGDELFGGYPSFVDVPRLRRLVRRTGWIPRAGRTALAALLALRRGTSAREKLGDILSGSDDLRRVYLQRRRLISDRGLNRLGIEPSRLGLTTDVQKVGMEDGAPAADPVAEISRLECQYYQANMLLRDADANGMAHGLELRVPFLDQSLAEYALSLPGSAKLPAGCATKDLLREVLRTKLGIEPNGVPKRGFTLPIVPWLLGPLADLAASALDRLARSGLVEGRGIGRIWEAFAREPNTPAWSRAFVLVVLGSYLEHHRLT